MRARRVVVTGATGNLGGKLCRALEDDDSFDLCRLDRDARGDPRVVVADLSVWDEAWIGTFAGAAAVVHLAANPTAHATWDELLGPNVDALVNVFLAAAKAGVGRVVYASSNHVMGGYKEDDLPPGSLSPDLPPRPGTRYLSGGVPRDSHAYAAAKLMGERLGKAFADAHGMSVIALRIGWIVPGRNQPDDLPTDREPWFHRMWLSNGDFVQLVRRCLDAPPTLRFALVNGMSDNRGMPWDLEPTRRLLGYEPRDGTGR